MGGNARTLATSCRVERGAHSWAVSLAVCAAREREVAHQIQRWQQRRAKAFWAASLEESVHVGGKAVLSLVCNSHS